MPPIGIHPDVLEARERIKTGRERQRQAHNSGASGLEICHALSDLLDQILLERYQIALSESPGVESKVALVFLGGNGRRDIAPFSDIDLMLLYEGNLTEEIKKFSKRISRDVTDMNVQLGYSVRTSKEACALSLADAFIFSSLTEARFLAGNPSLFERFTERFRATTGKKRNALIKSIIDAREKERIQYGETVYLLRPNVKRSRGGLRDIHLIRWLGFVLFQAKDLDDLLASGAISTADSQQLAESWEFLLRVRNEMHFHADRSNDGLGRNEQVRLAEQFGFADGDALLSVEEFMREYFRNTSRIRYICDHFVSKSQRRKKSAAASMLEPLVTRHLDEKFRMGPHGIGVSADAIDNMKNDLEQVLRLMQLAALHDKSLDHDTWIAIRHEMLKNRGIEFTQEAAGRFMALLSNTKGLGPLLRRLHEMKVLRKIIPGFEHVRGLLQFNEYHKFTVDEHTLQAIEKVVDFEEDNSIIGDTYRRIRHKNILHLALLLHDLGKGFPEDHSEVGRRIAQKTGERFGLTEDETETIKFLVHKHLRMSHLAFHRDINDDDMVANFATEVGSVQMLSMLFVLTCADISAVGPDVFNPWKRGLLTELFHRTKEVLTGQLDDYLTERYEQIYDMIASHSDDVEQQAWLKKTAKNLPNNYCLVREPSLIASQLEQIRTILPDGSDSGGVVGWVTPAIGSDLHDLCLAKVSTPRDGSFYKLVGLISGLGLEIVSTDIKALGTYEGNPLTWYRVQFEDPRYDKPPESRLREIADKSKQLLQDLKLIPPKFGAIWNQRETVALKLSRPEIRVLSNNDIVNSATVLDVFAYNKPGLLYCLSQKIYRLGLDVTFARVSTYAHQVIDVFYVTDEAGQKIRNPRQLNLIQQEILSALEDFLEPEDEQDPNKE